MTGPTSQCATGQRRFKPRAGPLQFIPMMRGLAIAFTALMLCALSSACANQNPLISESSGAQNRVRQQADEHAALALAYLNQRQTEAARAEARRALALAPGHRDALHTLALTALAQGDAGAARRHFEQAFNAEGGADDVTLRLNYARFLCEHHEVPAGRALLEYAPRPSPEHAQRIQSLLDVCKA